MKLFTFKAFVMVVTKTKLDWDFYVFSVIFALIYLTSITTVESSTYN